MLDPGAARRLGWRDVRRLAAPAPGEAHLYLVRVPGAGVSLEPLLARLSDEERARAADKRVEGKRREYVTGQACLRTLLGAALGIDPGAVRYARGAKGKPYLAGAARGALQFNITHSGEAVVIALARDAELGVDVEWHNERTEPERVARRAFSAAERAALAHTAPASRRAHFFRIWTCKEALVKCTGLGIHSGMAEFEVALRGEQARVAGAWGRQAGVERLHVIPLPLGDGHAGALVHEPPALTVRRFLLAASPDPLAGL